MNQTKHHLFLRDNSNFLVVMLKPYTERVETKSSEWNGRDSDDLHGFNDVTKVTHIEKTKVTINKVTFDKDLYYKVIDFHTAYREVVKELPFKTSKVIGGKLDYTEEEVYSKIIDFPTESYSTIWLNVTSYKGEETLNVRSCPSYYEWESEMLQYGKLNLTVISPEICNFVKEQFEHVLDTPGVEDAVWEAYEMIKQE